MAKRIDYNNAREAADRYTAQEYSPYAMKRTTRQAAGEFGVSVYALRLCLKESRDSREFKAGWETANNGLTCGVFTEGMTDAWIDGFRAKRGY